MENSKARLNEYLQATRQQIGQIKYTAMGPDHNRLVGIIICCVLVKYL